MKCIPEGAAFDELNGLSAPPPAYSGPSLKKAESTSKKELVEDLPRNILIIGETANGKSTLIRQLGRYAGNYKLNVKIGYGLRFSKYLPCFNG
jgi:predicted GTPase